MRTESVNEAAGYLPCNLYSNGVMNSAKVFSNRFPAQASCVAEELGNFAWTAGSIRHLRQHFDSLFRVSEINIQACS